MSETGTDLEISPEHLSCLRRLRFIWVPNIESGGVFVDPEAPFGSPNAYDDLAQAVPGKSLPELRRLYGEVMIRLPEFTERAKLAPGSYILPAADVLRLKKNTDGGDSGIAGDGSFRFTSEHAKLIGAVRWWYGEGHRFSFDFDASVEPQDGPYWRAAAVNFKRPFGDMTYFELDMAEILGVELDPDEELDPAQEERLLGLYKQMHVALQVFVLHAVL
jgi:hypothetical protein